MRHRLSPPSAACVLALTFALALTSAALIQAQADAPAATPTWGIAQADALLGLRLGMDCEAAVKVLGKSKYRFRYNALKIVGWESADHAIDADIQCLSDAVVSVSIRRVLPKSKLSAGWEAHLLAAPDAGDQIQAALGTPAATRAGSAGEQTRYHCTPSGGVIAWHLASPHGTLRQALLMSPQILPPDVRAAVSCAPSAP